MPELPEIETVKRQLSKRLVGATITSIKSLHPKSLYGDSKLVTGKKITAVDRLGKMLVIEVGKDVRIAIHFKMSGQLILVKSDKKQATSRIAGGHPTLDWLGDLPSKHTRVEFSFKNGDRMYFNDQRIFGWVKVLSKKELAEMSFVKRLGPEIWNVSDQELFEKLHKKKKAVKIAIMDQDFLSGIGNIYANDALWEAKIHPQKRCEDLSQGDCKRLRESLIKVLDEGIKYGGATAADAKYIDLHGMGGTYQDHFRTYGRTKLSCLRCKASIKKIVVGGRGTFFCPACQKL